MKLRNSAKGLVIHDGRLLLTRCEDASGTWYACPGGGQRPDESLIEAARRECLEETGALVEPGAMVAVLEFYDLPNATHAIEFYFRCRFDPTSEVTVGDIPDDAQVGVEWIALDRIAALDIRPHALRAVLADPERFQYLGMG